MDTLSPTLHAGKPPFLSLQNSKETAKFLCHGSISGTLINRFQSQPAPAGQAASPGLRCKKRLSPVIFGERPRGVGDGVGNRSQTDLSRR